MPLQRIPSLALTAALLTAMGGCGGTATPAAAPVPIRVATASTAPVSDQTEYLGALEADRQTLLRPQIQGRIRAIQVRPGQRVSPGQPMFILDSDQVSADASAARAEVFRQRAIVQDAQTRYKRQQFLVDQGATAKESRDQAQREYRTAVAQLKAAEQTAVARGVSVDYTVVRAPIAGTVGDFRLRVGDFVGTGADLTSILQNDRLLINIPVPIYRVPQLRLGQPVLLSDPFSKRTLAEGRVDFIAPDTEKSEQTVLVKVLVPNANGLLRNGQVVRSQIVWDRKTALLVPTQAVSPLAGADFVYIVQRTPDGEGALQVRQQAVKLGPIFDKSYQILSGLQPGQRVAVTNLLSLADKAAVTIQSTP
jgi:RND family efflux transporter MFP subunit